jgi:hypothetical protein
MATPALAIDGSRQLHLRTIGDLNAERSQLRADIEAARFRVSELEQEGTRLQELLDVNRAARDSLSARLRQRDMRSPARVVSVPPADSLRNKLKSEKDPRERFRIQQRINALSM